MGQLRELCNGNGNASSISTVVDKEEDTGQTASVGQCCVYFSAMSLSVG